MNVMAVDPGGTTGLAWWLAGSFGSAQIEDPMRAVARVERHLETWDVVVVENFIPRPGVRTWQPDALHIIGALRFLTSGGAAKFVLQPPADKTFGTDARLKAVGFHRPGCDHANDAARHLLKRLVRMKIIPLEEVLNAE